MNVNKKLLLVAIVVASVTGYLAYSGASSSWQYYLTVDECLDDGPALVGSRLRVSGKIAAGSLHLGADRRHATFSLEGSRGQLQVACAGSLPDNLAEAKDVVVEGRLDAEGVLCGEKVLTRCASKYQSQPSQKPVGGTARADLKSGP